MIKNTPALVLFLLIGLMTSCSRCNPDNLMQNEQIKENIMRDAEGLKAAILGNDYEKLATYSHPLVLASIGGIETLKDAMSDMKNVLASQGTTIEDIRFGEIQQLISHKGEYQGVIKQKMIMKTPDGQKVTEDVLLMLSENRGRSWYFVSVSGRDLQKMRVFIPSLSEDLSF